MVPGAILVLCLGAVALLATGSPDPATSRSDEVTEPVCRYLGPKQRVRREPRPADRPPTVRDQRERTRAERDVHLLQEYATRFPETFGGLSIEDRPRRRLYVQLRFTEDLAARRGEIRTLWDHPFRVTRVRWSLAHLEAVSTRLRDGRLKDAGIEPIGWGPDIRRNRVHLEAASERPDAAEVVRELYGEEVHLKVLGPSFYRTRCGVPARYRVLDPQMLELTWLGSGSVRALRGEVREGDEVVRVGIVLQVPYDQTSDLAPHRVTVPLAVPLGDREVRSIKRGRPVARD